MIRLRLFVLFIAFALLSLFRPRKCLEMLEAADAGAKAAHDAEVRRRMDMLVQRALPCASEVTRDEMEKVMDRHVRLGDIIQDWDDMVDAATDLANGIRTCPACLGNDADRPCAHPSAGQPGCLRDERLAKECPLPPAGWRCTRRAGHEGPCAAVEI